MAAVASAAHRLLAELRAGGFTVALAEGGGLRVSPAGDLDRRLRRLIGREKPALAALLRREGRAEAEGEPTPAPAAESAADAPRTGRQEPEATELVVGYRRRPGRASVPVTLRVPSGFSTAEAMRDAMRGCRPSNWDDVLHGPTPLERYANRGR